MMLALVRVTSDDVTQALRPLGLPSASSVKAPSRAFLMQLRYRGAEHRDYSFGLLSLGCGRDPRS